VRPAGFNAFQVLVVLAWLQRQDLVQVRLILVLEDRGVLTLLLQAAFIHPILRNLVNKEQRQNLDAFGE
jgi:hypothetical protein